MELSTGRATVSIDVETIADTVPTRCQRCDRITEQPQTVPHPIRHDKCGVLPAEWRPVCRIHPLVASTSGPLDASWTGSRSC